MDSYQPIYDAVRSRIGGCDVRSVVEDAARNAFDFGHARQMLQEQIYAVSFEMARPSVIWRPKVFQDGDQWCALLGESIADGVCGFGASPNDACYAFDKAWNEKLAAARADQQLQNLGPPAEGLSSINQRDK